jgi:hypothetical protein
MDYKPSRRAAYPPHIVYRADEGDTADNGDRTAASPTVKGG